MTPTTSRLTLVTPRLQLRPFADSDFAAYAACHGHPDVYRFLYAPTPSGAELEAQFRRSLSTSFSADGDALHLAVVKADEGIVIGEVLVKIAHQAALQAEVGYIFHPAFAGRGYATEAARALLGHVFGVLGFHRVFARLDVLNIASVGVAERLGMRREAHLIQNDRFDGVWGDEYIYALLRSEWQDKNPT